MVIREIVVSRSVRVNTGNYEGLEHFMSMKAELDELDDETAVARRLTETVERSMVEQLVRSYRVRGKSGMTHEKTARHHGLTYVPAE